MGGSASRRIPEIALFIECVSSLAVGVVLAVGGRLGSPGLSSQVRAFFIPLLNGPSLGTTILGKSIWR